MNELSKFKEFSISKMDEAKITGGFALDWVAICNCLYAGIGISQLEGDKVAASAYFQAWSNMGC